MIYCNQSKIFNDFTNNKLKCEPVRPSQMVYESFKCCLIKQEDKKYSFRERKFRLMYAL